MDHKISAQKDSGPKQGISYHKPTQLYSILLRTSALVLFWWVLNRGDHASWIIGAPFIAAAIALSMVLAPPRAGIFMGVVKRWCRCDTARIPAHHATASCHF